MLVQPSKRFAIVAVATLLAIPALWGQAPQKNWKDRGEYDLYDSITKEAGAAKKLELLNAWKEKYPATDFKQERLQLYLTTYQALNQPAKMVETAQEMLANDPKDLQALYWIAFLTPSLGKNTEDVLQPGEKAASGLLSNLDTFFAPEKKPPQATEADWKKARTDMEAAAQKTLGWIAMQRKNNEDAAKAFRSSLDLNPNAGEVSYWLGTVLLGTRKAENISPALYHFARAAYFEGQGALVPQGRHEVGKYLEKVYTNFHGDRSGLDELLARAKVNAIPPDDFKIESSYEIAARKEEEFKKTNPMLALWMSVKKELTGPNGEAYFESNVKGAGLPGGAEGIQKFKGKLISHKPPRNPKELVIGIADPNTPEVTLVLDEPLTGRAEAGTEIAFEGVASAFTREPFMVTFDVEKAQLQGWPAPAPAAKKAPKKAVKKK